MQRQKCPECISQRKGYFGLLAPLSESPVHWHQGPIIICWTFCSGKEGREDGPLFHLYGTIEIQHVPNIFSLVIQNGFKKTMSLAIQNYLPQGKKFSRGPKQFSLLIFTTILMNQQFQEIVNVLLVLFLKSLKAVRAILKYAGKREKQKRSLYLKYVYIIQGLFAFIFIFKNIAINYYLSYF